MNNNNSTHTPSNSNKIYSKSDFILASETPGKQQTIETIGVRTSEPTPLKKYKAEGPMTGTAMMRRTAMLSNNNKSNVKNGDLSSLKSFYEKRAEDAEQSKGWVHSVPSFQSRPVDNRDSNSSEIKLSIEQLEIIKLIQEGKNVFFTGAAGTGKSTVLRWTIENLPKQGTYVTASTGIAAINIGGTTIHSFAGIRTGLDSKENLLENVMDSFTHKTNWQRAKTLIIDEVSMVDRDLFEKLDYLAQKVRKSNLPFGGIQIICTGDFFQLPPVDKSGFCFESPVWNQTFDHAYQLSTVFRQLGDQSFLSILSEIRVGNCSESTRQTLENAQYTFVPQQNRIEPTILFPLNRDVDHFNNEKLNLLTGKGKLFRAKDQGPPAYRDALEKNCPVPSELKLKVGAQVMLVKTSSRTLDREYGLVNGIRGIVVGFDQTHRGFPIVLFTNKIERTIEPTRFPIESGGVEVAFREQVPLKLAWAISIHKCQGSTITCAELSMNGIFEYGQAYVALSRVSSLESLRLRDFNPKAIRANPKVVDFYNSLQTVSSTGVAIPISPIKTPPSFAFKVEYAKSGRSKCRTCDNHISLSQLRIGEYTLFKDKTNLRWHHYDCFFSSFTQAIKDPGSQIEGWEILKKNDKEKLGRTLGITDVFASSNPGGLAKIKENLQKAQTLSSNENSHSNTKNNMSVHNKSNNNNAIIELDDDFSIGDISFDEDELSDFCTVTPPLLHTPQKTSSTMSSLSVPTTPKSTAEEKKREEVARLKHEEILKQEELMLTQQADQEDEIHLRILNPVPLHQKQASKVLFDETPLPSLDIFQNWKLEHSLNKKKI